MNRIPAFIKWLVATVVGVAVLTTGFYVKGQENPTKPVVTKKDSTDVRSLLLQLTDGAQNVGGVVVLTNDKDTGLSLFNVPINSVASFGEAGLMTIGDAGNRLPPNLVADGISAATGIRIEGTLTLQQLAMAGLIDSVGGVVVDPKAGLLVSAGDDSPLYVAPGHRKLDGRYGSGYVMVKQLTENDSDQFARINDVLAQVLSKLPTDSNKLDETLSALGSLARSDVSTKEISKFLIQLNSSRLWEEAKFFPVVTDASELELMPESDWLRIRQPDTWNLVAVHAPNSLAYFTKAKTRIEIRSEVPADRATAAGDVTSLGFHFIDGGYAKTPDKTIIIASSGVAEGDIKNLRSRLGLAEVPIGWDFSMGEYSDVRIILGKDYRDQQLEQVSVN